ncbi:growth/differentiation factor 6-A-like [Triplophysa dalaica]|uniref:growth/differentiation factor 6-A-like n=1 Tax=Triplophysa dalaica TaxID=1582913 RepID=UPI0024E03F93|nr:growth/differentiation factor 6-A-like [Triplophysa dalaica]
MCVLLCAVVVLLAFPLGNMFVLRPAAEAHRCREEVEIRKILLESLNLQQEPRVSVSEMKHLREHWKDAVSTTAVNSTFPEESGKTTQQKCCKHSSQIFIKDLGWDGWIVYPETFTFTRCTSCGLNHCSENASSSTQCCKPTAHDILPFVYVDDWSSLVVSSVSVASECGCDPGEGTKEPEVMTPS